MREVIYRIIYGSFGAIIGIMVTINAHKIVDNTARVSWAEKYLGAGGTYLLARIIGIFMAFGFFSYAIGIWDKIYKTIIGG